jgi:hypothetical protein
MDPQGVFYGVPGNRYSPQPYSAAHGFPPDPEGETLGRQTVHFEIFKVTRWGNSVDAPIELRYCRACALFRKKRRGPKSERCKCNVRLNISRFQLWQVLNDFTSEQRSRTWNYRLDPWDDDLPDFRLYRKEIKDQLRNNKDFFRDRFLEAMGWYPKLRHDEFRIRIFIDISRMETKVVGVVLEAMDEDDPRKNLVLTFQARYPKSSVLFDVMTHVSLRKGEYVDPKSRNGASIIARALSDRKPKMGITWQLSPEIYSKVGRPRPHIFKLMANLFCR